MKNPLLVNASELLRRPGSVKSFDLDVQPSSIGLDSSLLIPDSPISVHLTAESLTDGVVINGHVRVAFRGECRRCLGAIEGYVDVEVHELYQVNVSDPDAFPIVGDQIDLVPMVRENVLLEVPEAPVCRPDCAGLCPQCGIDRNTQTCDCVLETGDSRWAALEGWREQFPE